MSSKKCSHRVPCALHSLQLDGDEEGSRLTRSLMATWVILLVLLEAKSAKTQGYACFPSISLPSQRVIFQRRTRKYYICLIGKAEGLGGAQGERSPQCKAWLQSLRKGRAGKVVRFACFPACFVLSQTYFTSSIFPIDL